MKGGAPPRGTPPKSATNGSVFRYFPCAGHLDVSPLTVRNAGYNIQKKLGFKTKQHMVVWAVRIGLLDGRSTFVCATGDENMLLGAAGRIPGDWGSITPELLAEVAAEGFGALNIIVQDPVSMTSQDIARLRAMFEEAGVLVGQTNGAYGGGLVSPDHRERETAIEFARRMCGLTAQLGSPDTYLRPGSLNTNGPWLPHPGNRSDEVFDRLVDSARKFCRTAQDEGVMVAVEGGAVSPIYSARRVRDFIEAVGSPVLGFNQDPVNFIGGLEDAYDTTRLLTEFFELTGKFTLGAHAKDFTVMDQLMVRFEEAEIGSGLLDHVTFLQGMQRVCPTGHVLIEHLPLERYAAAAVEYRKYASLAGIEWDNQTGENRGES